MKYMINVNQDVIVLQISLEKEVKSIKEAEQLVKKYEKVGVKKARKPKVGIESRPPLGPTVGLS